MGRSASPVQRGRAAEPGDVHPWRHPASTAAPLLPGPRGRQTPGAQSPRIAQERRSAPNRPVPTRPEAANARTEAVRGRERHDLEAGWVREEGGGSGSNLRSPFRRALRRFLQPGELAPYQHPQPFGPRHRLIGYSLVNALDQRGREP